MEMEDILKQNPWWSTTGWEGHDYHLRNLQAVKFKYRRVEDAAMEGGVRILYGPRQVGKTTWIKQQISEKIRQGAKPADFFYLNAETLKDRFELAETIGLVCKTYAPRHIFVDEISSLNEWEYGIKVLVDAGDLDGKTIILTGSSSLNLLRKAERLPGRTGPGRYKFRFYPLSFAEVAALYGIRAASPKEALLHLDRLNAILRKYFLHGGYIRALNYLDQKRLLDEPLFAIYSSWIDGELSKAGKTMQTATEIMDGVALAMTNETSWSSLARSASHPTIASYVEVLQDMFVLSCLEKSRRASAGAPRNKKIYFADPFLYWLSLFRSRKINTASASELDTATLGKLAELSAYAALCRQLDEVKNENDFDARHYVHFERNGAKEIDFALRTESRSVNIECKFGHIGKEMDGVIYLTEKTFDSNKLPLAVFLMDPLGSLKFARNKK